MCLTLEYAHMLCIGSSSDLVFVGAISMVVQPDSTSIRIDDRRCYPPAACVTALSGRHREKQD